MNNTPRDNKAFFTCLLIQNRIICQKFRLKCLLTCAAYDDTYWSTKKISTLPLHVHLIFFNNVFICYSSRWNCKQHIVQIFSSWVYVVKINSQYCLYSMAVHVEQPGIWVHDEGNILQLFVKKKLLYHNHVNIT